MDELVPPKTFHRFRAELLEQAVRLEYRLDDALAAGYAQSYSVAQELRAEVLSRLPMQQRIKTLRRIMDSRDLSDHYPFVVPVLNEVFKIRNVFAHNLSDGYNDKKDQIALVGMKDGAVVRHTYSTDFLHGLLRVQAKAVERELGELFFLIAPATEVWHEG